MTISEIKKALECCHTMAVKCSECPLHERKGDWTDGMDCDDVLHDEILKVWDNMVQVVRCKDCKWWVKQNVGGVCQLNFLLASSDNWFCADGERRDDAERNNT